MAAAVIGSAVIGGAVASSSAKTAAAAQTKAAEMGIDAQIASTAMSVEEQRRQFDEAKALLQPYVDAGEPALTALSPYAEAGTGALQGQLALAGLSGVDAQREAIGAIVQRATRLAPDTVIFCLDQIRAAGRAAQQHRRVRRDTTIEAAALDITITTHRLFNFHYRNAVQRHLLQTLIRRSA